MYPYHSYYVKLVSQFDMVLPGPYIRPRLFEGLASIVFHMVPILNSNPEKGAHVRCNLCYLICWRHLDHEQSQIRFLFLQKRPFSFICAQHVLGYHLKKYHIYFNNLKMKAKNKYLQIARESKSTECKLAPRTPSGLSRVFPPPCLPQFTSNDQAACVRP